MNVKRIKALADLIEKQPHTSSYSDQGFNMNLMTHPCGTPSCIAGWAAWERKGRPNKMSDYDVYVDASIWLGLGNTPSETSEDLFYPGIDNYEDITPAQAASTLRHLAKTGEVVWEIEE